MTVDQTSPPAQVAPFFIVGSARSGTTLLRDLLRSHSRMFIGSESRFVPWLHATYGDPTRDSEAIRLGAEILRILGRRDVWAPLTSADFAHCRSFREAAALPFERSAAASGKPRWGDKSPHYVEHIPRLISIFPNALIVHIVRDGRDVARSMTRTHFAPQTVFAAATIWRQRVQHGRAALDRFGAQRVHELRYEELLSNPEATLRALLAFLGEDFEPAVLTRSTIVSRPPRTWIGPLVSNYNNTVTIDPGRAGRWIETMPTADQILFESIAADALATFDYPVRGLAQPIGRLIGWRWTLEEALRTLWVRLRTTSFTRHWLQMKRMRRRARRCMDRDLGT